jgi:hypothetical protein
MNDETTRPLPHDGDEPTRALSDETRPEPPTSDPGQPPGHGPASDPGQPSESWPSPGPSQPPFEDDSGGRHPLSVAHLVAGLVFLGIAVSWLLRETGIVEAEATGWFLPLTLVVAGAVGLVAWFGSARGRSR